LPCNRSRVLGIFWVMRARGAQPYYSCDTKPQRAILRTSAKSLQHFAAITGLPPLVVVVPACTPHRCCQTDWTPTGTGSTRSSGQGALGLSKRKGPGASTSLSQPLRGCSFVKSCLMVTHQKPDSESGVHNSSMAYGALTVPASSCSMSAVAGLEGCSSASGLRLAAPERGWL
jgi:hypothetical protein